MRIEGAPMATSAIASKSRRTNGVGDLGRETLSFIIVGSAAIAAARGGGQAKLLTIRQAPLSLEKLEREMGRRLDCAAGASLVWRQPQKDVCQRLRTSCWPPRPSRSWSRMPWIQVLPPVSADISRRPRDQLSHGVKDRPLAKCAGCVEKMPGEARAPYERRLRSTARSIRVAP